MLNTLTKTTTVLLEGLHDPKNQAIWIEFDSRYRAVLYGLARRLGLDHADAEDVAQQTLLEFVRDYQADRYDKSRGRLRSWILGIVRHRIIDTQRAHARRSAEQGASFIECIPDDKALTAAWDVERSASILRLALQELRSNGRHDKRSIEAFELFGLKSMSAREVASECDMAVDDVYAAKYRVGMALKSVVARIETVYDDDG